MRILFVTSNRIGDAVLSTGLLDHLARAHPEAWFTVACGPSAEGIFTRMPRLERLITMEKRRHGRHWLPLWAASVGTWWELVVDIRASALGWLVPTRRRVAMRKRAGWRSRHKVAQFGDLLGLDPPPMPVAWTAPADDSLARRFMPAGRPIVILAPTANWGGKIWPAERFVGLFRALAAGPLPGARAMVLAGPGAAERALAAPVLAALPDAIDGAGTLSLPEAAACLRRAALFVGNDSGPMHLAAAAGAPTLGVFGPTKANIPQFSPAGPRTAMAVSPTLAMDGLSIEAAFQAALPLLAA